MKPGSTSSGARRSRKKEEEEARSRFEDPQKIIEQMKLKERPSYNATRQAAQNIVNKPKKSK
jgi:hypothetical protein